MSRLGRAGALARPCILGAALAALAFSASAEEAAVGSLPEPLTLEHALTLADETHPDLTASRAALEGAEARRLRAGATDDFEASLTLDARWVEPPELTTYPDENNDSRAILSVSKRLYDFGRTSNAVEAADAGVRASEWLLRDTQSMRRLDVMRRYFDVILADVRYERENEDMSVAYVAMDKARDRNELGQISDIELLRLEDEYQTVRMRRYAAAAGQRASRSLLAQALGRPADLPSRVLPPFLPGNDAAVPTYEQLVELALRQNPRVLALREQLEGARSQLAASRAGKYPILSSEFEAAAYEQEFGSRQPFIASLVLEVPLYTGDRVNAETAAARAELMRVQADLERTEYWLRQQVLEVWQALNNLNAQREQVNVRHDFRGLYLDRSRAEYELDIRTDLGDAMVALSDARLLDNRTEFELALAWEQLAILTGESSLSALLPPGEKPPSLFSEGTTP